MSELPLGALIRARLFASLVWQEQVSNSSFHKSFAKSRRTPPKRRFFRKDWDRARAMGRCAGI